MTILQSLAERYERLAAEGRAPIRGFAPSQIGFTFVLSVTGQVVTINDERSDDKKRRPRLIEAPQAPNDRRGERIVAGTFWDPADYAIGVPRPDLTGSEAAVEKLSRKAVEKFAAFKTRHQTLLANSDDQGCLALLRFLDRWTPENLSTLPYANEIPGHNIAFRIDGETGYLHERKAARDLLDAEMSSRDVVIGTCLVTGDTAPIARLHSPIKGIGDKLAPLVSFNEDSFTSYGKVRGANAPVSEAAAFAYATALNGLLAASRTNAKGRPIYPNRVMLGETTVPFWAEHDEAETIVGALMGEDEEFLDDALPVDEATETVKLGDVLRKMQDGVPLSDAAPAMDPASRVYVLGLSPNAARLSVRFWVEQSLADFTRHFQQHWQDMELEPKPHPWPPPLWRLLLELAPQREAKNIPPHLGGEVMRAILSGLPYPRALLVQTILRIRADRDAEDRGTDRTLEKVSDLRVALLKACLTRMYRWKLIPEDVPMSLDLATTNSAYRLGRLFSVLERLQRAALGQRNATVRDRFYASASATPALVFPSLIRNARNHSKTLRSKVGAGLAEWFEDHIAEIASGLAGSFPKTLPLEEQGRFALGYYHQRDVFRRKKDVPAEIDAAEAAADTSSEEP